MCFVMLTRECVELAVSDSCFYSFDTGNTPAHALYTLGRRLMIYLLQDHPNDSMPVEGRQ